MMAIALKNAVRKLEGGTNYGGKTYTKEVEPSFELLKGKGFFIFVIDGENITIANISCLNRKQHLNVAGELTKLSQEMLNTI